MSEVCGIFDENWLPQPRKIINIAFRGIFGNYFWRESWSKKIRRLDDSLASLVSLQKGFVQLFCIWQSLILLEAARIIWTDWGYSRNFDLQPDGWCVCLGARSNFGLESNSMDQYVLPKLYFNFLADLEHKKFWQQNVAFEALSKIRAGQS